MAMEGSPVEKIELIVETSGKRYFHLSSYLEDFNCRKYTENIQAIHWAITAANAAPLIPKRGKGPIPKIKKGSRIAREIEAIKTTFMDKRGLPSARNKLLDIMEKKRKGELKTII